MKGQGGLSAHGLFKGQGGNKRRQLSCQGLAAGGEKGSGRQKVKGQAGGKCTCGQAREDKEATSTASSAVRAWRKKVKSQGGERGRGGH